VTRAVSARTNQAATSTMKSTSRQVAVLLAVLAAACARPTEEWAFDVLQWDPFRRDVAIAALGRVPRSEVDAATRALLRLTSISDDATRARFIDSLQRLCRADFDAVVRACAQAQLNADMTRIVMGAVKSSSVTSAPFLRYLVTIDTTDTDRIGAYLPDIGTPEAQTLTELFLEGSPVQRLRALEILSHKSLLESHRLGRLSEEGLRNVTIALQRVVDDSRTSAAIDDEMRFEIRMRAILELIATGIVPIRDATELTADELAGLMLLCGDKVDRIASLATYVVQYVFAAPAPEASEGPVGIDSLLNARDSARAEQRALALLASARSDAAHDELRGRALAALEAEEVSLRIAGLMALERITRPGDEVPAQVSKLAASDKSVMVREAASKVRARAEPDGAPD
jgi:hypothetical protein